MRIRKEAVVPVILSACLAAFAESDGMFPFVIRANGKNPAMDMSFLLPAPAGKDGFVRAAGEHFVTDRGRIRFNGVNLVGAACFPDHAHAERLAERLARLGLNIVRIHYIDTWAYGSNFMKAPMAALYRRDPSSSRLVDEAQRDRLEYLIAQLKRRGVYVNMNLHVAQELDERDGVPKTPWANRGADFFHAPLIEKEKEYARDVLGHVNPYTGLALKDDPCLAMVEINNENGMFSTWPNGLLDGGERFGAVYRDEFRRQWQAFSGSTKDYLRARAPGPSYTPAETNAFFRFLAHIDATYFDAMRACLKDELGVRVPICATQIDYCTPHTLARQDIVDIHLYWTHPGMDGEVPAGVDLRRGPHRNVPWCFRNASMVASRRFARPYDEDFVPHRATMRVKGRPFMVSETSSPYPNWYGAEFNPFMRALAAFQDWGAVITHSWNNDLDPEPDHATFFFSFAGRTDCVAHFPAMAAMFLRGDVAPAAERIDVNEDAETYFARLAAKGLARAGVHASPARITGGRFRSAEILLRGVGVDLTGKSAAFSPLDGRKVAEMDGGVYDNGQFRLDQGDPQKAFFLVRTRNTKLFTGFSSLREFDLGDGVRLEPGATRLGWCTVSLVSLTGDGFGKGSRILLAATGLAHNGGAKFSHLHDSAWTARDADFGLGKYVVEGVRARLVLPAEGFRCRALGEDGEPVRDVPTRSRDGVTVVEIGPECRTVWYELSPGATTSADASHFERTFDFSEGKWDRGAFFEARNDDWDRGSPIVQMPDCVMNANDPGWSDEELFRDHQADVYSSLILTNSFSGDLTFSSRLSFDHRMAPSLVLAGAFATDAQGRKAFRDHYEIVLFEEGINVWRHRRPGGGKSEIEKVAYARHAFSPKTPYVLTVEVRRKKGYGGRPTTDIRVLADGIDVGFRDETVPASYFVGLLGSEGRCRFYDLKVRE